MGYMRHHAILVTSWDTYSIEEAKGKAFKLFPECLVSSLNQSNVNLYYSFAIFPDGSKENWEESNVCDKARDEYIGWLNKQRYEDNSSKLSWVCVQYGDEEHETKIIADSDELIRKEGYKR